MRSHRLDSLWVFVLVTFVLCGTAHAYIDPGAGSLALQMALAAVFACLFFVRASWAKVRTFFGHPWHPHPHGEAGKQPAARRP
ncbi:MAG TPA: hypothetical protein VGK67_37190 [Myxococcales bacterium]|jgi:hydrogenase-4 membrane subunit HyfE